MAATCSAVAAMHQCDLTKKAAQSNISVQKLISNLFFGSHDIDLRRLERVESILYNKLLSMNVGVPMHYIIFRLLYAEGRIFTYTQSDLEKLVGSYKEAYGISCYNTNLQCYNRRFWYMATERPPPPDSSNDVYVAVRVNVLDDYEVPDGPMVIAESSSSTTSTETATSSSSSSATMSIQSTTSPSNQPAAFETTFESIKHLINIINATQRLPEEKMGSYFIRGQFNDLYNYVIRKGPAFKGLPPATMWGGIPFMLSDDSQSSIYTYRITDTVSCRSLKNMSFSEVFLENLPMTVINFDIDRYNPPTVNITTIANEFLELLRRACATFYNTQIVSVYHIGSLRIYVRDNALPEKFSARFVWHVAIDLCFTSPITFREFGEVFLNIIRGSENFFHYRRLASNNGQVLMSKTVAVDMAPYHPKKSCRLPNALKGENGRFTFNGLFNVIIEDQLLSTSVAIGLSRQRVDFTRPITSHIGVARALKTFNTLLAEQGGSLQVTASPAVSTLTAQAVGYIVAEYKARVDLLWPKNRFQEFDSHVKFYSSDKEPFCPIHRRNHRRAKNYVYATKRGAYFRCFHSDPGSPPITSNQYYFLQPDGTISVRDGIRSTFRR